MYKYHVGIPLTHNFRSDFIKSINKINSKLLEAGIKQSDNYRKIIYRLMYRLNNTRNISPEWLKDHLTILSIEINDILDNYISRMDIPILINTIDVSSVSEKRI